MGIDYNLKQHLKMSPNAQIKNLVPEILEEVPSQEDWKLGRIWYNSTIGKFQTVSLKMDSNTGLPIEPQELEVVLLGSDEIGFARDGEYYPDGLFNFNSATKVSDAVDEINEALKDMAPPEATPLNGDLIVSTTHGFKAGKIAKRNDNGQSIRLEGVNEGDYINYIIIDDNLTATLPTAGFVVKDIQQSQFGKADQGQIVGYYDNSPVDSGIDLYSNFNEPSRDYYGVTQGYVPEINQDVTASDGTVSTITANPNKLNYRSSTGFLTVNNVERYNDFKKWQKGDGIVNIGTLSGQSSIEAGRHTFYVKHKDIPGGDYDTNLSEIFYDPNKDEVETTLTEFVLKSADTKFVSGVEFLNSNITFKTSLYVKNAFSNTYWDKPISLTASHTDAGMVAWNDNASSLAGETIPFWDDIINLDNYIINYNGINTHTMDITLYAKAGKVTTDWGTTVSSSLKLLVDTYPVSGNSTYLKETFNDEDYRLPEHTNFDDGADVIAAVGTWDSTQDLTVNNAQQFMGKLQIAKDNYSSFGDDTDYTTFQNDDQIYYRPIYAANKANSNGTLKISTTANIGADYDAFIKFPGISGWLDINKLYDVQDFNNNKTTDGTGCAININETLSSLIVQWTIGTNSTHDSNFSYVVKIILKNKNINITEIEEISDSWR